MGRTEPRVDVVPDPNERGLSARSLRTRTSVADRPWTFNFCTTKDNPDLSHTGTFRPERESFGTRGVVAVFLSPFHFGKVQTQR